MVTTMSKRKMSPAPWKLIDGEEGPPSIVDVNGVLIATSVRLEDAPLILVAPALLHFVQWYVDFCEDSQDGEWLPGYCTGRELIDRAKAGDSEIQTPSDVFPALKELFEAFHLSTPMQDLKPALERAKRAIDQAEGRRK